MNCNLKLTAASLAFLVAACTHSSSPSPVDPSTLVPTVQSAAPASTPVPKLESNASAETCAARQKEYDRVEAEAEADVASRPADLRHETYDTNVAIDIDNFRDGYPGVICDGVSTSKLSTDLVELFF